MPETATDILVFSSDLAALGVPKLEDYFGVWAIREEEFRGLADRATSIDIRAHVQAHQTPEAVAAASAQAALAFDTVAGGGPGEKIALIELNGSLMKTVGSMTRGTSTIAARRQIRMAAQAEDVTGILLWVDSPGGTVAGTQELGDDIAAAAKRKPVYAQIEDLGASAAYWLAAQSTQIFANRTALVGSIGTFMAVQDLSGMAAKEGIKVHVIRAGSHKGAGVPGTEVTSEQLAEFQRIVDSLNSHFLAAVGQGRKMAADKVAALADGRVHPAEQARSLGLIDGVQSLDQTLAQLRKVSSSSAKGPRAMSDTPAPAAATPAPAAPAIAAPAAPQPASIHELKQGIPSADSNFIVAQLEKRATLEQAKTAWMEEQDKRIKAKDEELEKARATSGGKPGVKALATERTESSSNGGNATDRFNEAVEAKIKTGKSRAQAVAAVVRDNPELQQQMIDESNQNRGKRR